MQQLGHIEHMERRRRASRRRVACEFKKHLHQREVAANAIDDLRRLIDGACA
jgi:hypothetical protein